ncbi:MAG: flavin reductase family protein [Gammaproteobacteria bacterium]
MHIDDSASQFVAAMRGWAASVCVLSASSADGKRHAMTVTSFTPISIEPPCVLVCANMQSSVCAALQEGRPFTINLLHSNQQDLSMLCADNDRIAERMASDEWLYDASGTPWLQTAQANFFCTQLQLHEVATHTVVMAQVDKINCNNSCDPLIYLNGHYHGSMDGKP